MNKKDLIRIIYIYIFSLVGLVLIITSSIRMVNLSLQTYFFKEADRVMIYPLQRPLPYEKEKTLTEEEEEIYYQNQIKYEQEERKSRRQKTASDSLAMLIIGTPLFLYHWRLAQKEREK